MEQIMNYVKPILTHISSPEMTECDNTYKALKADFDSHLLTGDDRNILISTILPDTKYPFFFK